MSNYQPKPNSLSIFKNDRKRDDKDPDYSGTLYFENGNGEIVEHFIDLWVNEIRSGEKQGKKYFGGRIKRKEKQRSLGDSYGDRDRSLGEHQRSMSYTGAGAAGPVRVTDSRGGVGEDEIPF